MQPLRKREEQWSKVEHHVITIWEGFTPTEDTHHGRVEETNTTWAMATSQVCTGRHCFIEPITVDSHTQVCLVTRVHAFPYITMIQMVLSARYKVQTFFQNTEIL